MADEQYWDQYLQQTSALGIIKPDAISGVFRGGGGGSGDPGPSTEPLPADPEVNNTPVAIRVVQTANTPNGRSVFASDEFVYGYYPYTDGAAFAAIDKRSNIPVAHRSAAAASSSSSSSSTPPRCPSSGTAFVLCEVPPFRAAMPPRRTLTVDYVVVVTGELTVCLDGDVSTEKRVRAGDVLVQQGTQHMWRNQTDMPCRLLYVMVAGRRITLANGTVLDKSG
ncbi:hypothetical protein Sste5346_005075 [Sporothrix stenoceras]|uniref:Cupin type-2 domain-containing protein n=1 Tax=Sporothrix stenoceras TaxID=5173 RepID=A0ABR3Z4Q3_9PEZI